MIHHVLWKQSFSVKMDEQYKLIPEEILAKLVKSNESLLLKKFKKIPSEEYNKFQCWIVDKICGKY